MGTLQTKQWQLVQIKEVVRLPLPEGLFMVGGMYTSRGWPPVRERLGPETEMNCCPTVHA